MNRSSTPGVGQWITVTLIVAVALFLLIKLYQYATFRVYYPTGLTVAGVDVGGMTPEEASEVLNNLYLNAPVVVFHGEDKFEISPTEAKFQLDLETMLSQADFQRSQQDFWAGFWGFLWGRPVEVDPVPLAATHDREALRDVLNSIATLSDLPAQPPQPVPATLSFQYGEAGTRTNIEASFNDVEAALYRPSNRVAYLVVEPRSPQRPEINLLSRLLVNHMQDFELTTGGVASVFVLDLVTGEEVAVRSDVAMSAMDLMKVPIVLTTYRMLDNPPTLSQRELISNTLVLRPEHDSANLLLNVIAGEDDPVLGARLVTETMQKLGLVNTFMMGPYDADLPPGIRPLETPANSREDVLTTPNEVMQTTAEDMGTLLSMLYYCAHDGSGALVAVFPNELTQAECQEMLQIMAQNRIGSLIEAGVPQNTAVSHRHGWISDTHGDAGVVFSPAGDYVIVSLIYKPNWLEWELSSPLIADMSRATYNYFNFDAPYLGGVQVNN